MPVNTYITTGATVPQKFASAGLVPVVRLCSTFVLGCIPIIFIVRKFPFKVMFVQSALSRISYKKDKDRKKYSEQ